VFSLVDAANSSSSPNYVENMENMADMQEWMRTFAANHAAGNIDSFGTQISQNMYGYIGVNGTKYTLMPWDLNIDLGGPKSWAPGQNLLEYDSNDANMGVIFHTPAFLRMYWRAQQDLINGPLDIDLTTGALLNAKYQAFVANGLEVENPNSALLPWIASARLAIASQLSQVDATNFTVNPAVVASNDVVFVSGAAPMAVGTIWINGAAWPITWTTLTNWTLAVPLHSGTNQLSITAIDPHGQAMPGYSGSASVLYNGTIPSPVGRVVINEIMYDPVVPGASFLELYNNSSNTTYDLSGWQVPGLF
jgi:hypothetical protein